MKLPDEAARLAILGQLAAVLPAALMGLELARIVEATEGFTGADLKRVVEDGKALYAFDRATGRAPRPTTEYFLDAVQTVRDNKARYAQAEARARASRPNGPSFFDMVQDRMAFAEAGNLDED